MKAHTGHDIASGLLRTYLGHDAGNRVYSGAVERGTVDGLRSVLWYADLRGFTRISDVSSGAAIVEMLNDTFETLTAPLRPRGGHVLKFIGDAMRRGAERHSAGGGLFGARLWTMPALTGFELPSSMPPGGLTPQVLISSKSTTRMAICCIAPCHRYRTTAARTPTAAMSSGGCGFRRRSPRQSGRFSQAISRCSSASPF
jgi:class 3 adenylate cyclase